MMPPTAPLWGAQAVHIGHWSPVAGAVICVACKVNVALDAEWSCCDRCPGWIESACGTLPDTTAGTLQLPELTEAA